MLTKNFGSVAAAFFFSRWRQQGTSFFCSSNLRERSPSGASADWRRCLSSLASGAQAWRRSLPRVHMCFCFLGRSPSRSRHRAVDISHEKILPKQLHAHANRGMTRLLSYAQDTPACTCLGVCVYRSLTTVSSYVSDQNGQT
jgi:hypothetical protein